jgi:uncharacterized protein YjbI with pentapeptide repeats
MPTDVFNNPSNDYVNPGLAPCVNVPDGNSGDFKFIDDGAGVVVGSDIASFMDLSDITIHVTTWASNKITLQSGEVIYVPGLEKGLMNRKQVFNILSSGYAGSTSKYFMIVDLSISYYNNFKHYDINIEASSNYSQNIDIDDALNIALGNNNIKAEVTYDPSSFTFIGTQEGYDFEISNIVLTLIDSSTDANSPFIYPPILPSYELEEDASLALPAMKYPNGAMLGYILKARYPTTECYRDWWIYMNHVHSPFIVFDPKLIINEIIDIEEYKSIIFDPSITWGPFIIDLSVGLPDVVVSDVSINDIAINPTDASIDISTGITIDGSIVSWRNISSSIITDSSIDNSNIYDSSISGSYLNTNFIITSDIHDSSILNSGVISTNITESYINPSQLESCDVSLSTATSTLFVDSNLYGVILSDSSIKNSFIGDTDELSYNISTAGMLSYYNFDNNIIDQVDVVPATWNGPGSPTYVPGIKNQALFFKESGNFITTGYTNPYDWTVSFFYKLDTDISMNISGGIWGMADDSTTPNNKIEINFIDGSIGLTFEKDGSIQQFEFKNLQDGEWHHIILSNFHITSSLCDWKLYIDDPITPFWELSCPLGVDVSNFAYNWIGRGVDAGTQAGAVDEFRIYDRLLTNKERFALQYNDVSTIISSYVSNAYAENLMIENAILEELYIKDSSIYGSSVTLSEFYDIFINNSNVSTSKITGDSSTTIITNSIISDSSLQYVVGIDSSFNNVSVKDSSISGSYISNSRIDDSSLAFIDASGLIGQNVIIDAGILYNSYLEDSIIYDTEVRDSSLLRVIFTVDSSIHNSVIEDTRINYLEAVPGIWITDPSSERMEIFGGVILDTCIFNTTIYDAIIYTSNIDDCSLYNCIIYNSNIDSSSLIEDSSTYRINSECIIDVSYGLDSSIFYQKFSKRVDVGRSGSGDATTLSAADYLDYINSNDLWFKVGPYSSRFSAPDHPESNQKNLIGGFYLFNPQTFPVNIEYMLLNREE